MLDRDQRETLSTFVLAQLPANPNPAAIAIYVGEEIANELPTLSQLRDIALWMIDQTLLQPLPGPLIQLIRIVDDHTEAIASVVALADRLEGNAQLWTDWRNMGGEHAGDPLHIQDGRPFIDRARFRDYLPKLDETQTPDCILVEGNAGSGKSYLSEYLKRLSTLRRNFEVGVAAVGTSSARSMTPYMVALDIALGLKTDLTKKPREHEDPHRYARNLVAWITEFTPDRPAPGITVFDGFDADGLPEPVHTFIEALIRAVQEDDVTRQRMRVLLLGYDAARLEQLDLGYQRYPLEHLDESHIQAWLQLRFPGNPDYQYEDAASFVIEQLPHSGDRRLHHLCSLVSAVMNQFTENP